ncbi:hypothetical protein P152DRAFT_153937 [Eremomyces bilateralis CBS 781.70]|uniref:Uncharacterized protein n=1 Tax=Eremomyces bilateralis CBS 781.70 TaxID=1392243 RepID=A0A6G1FV31_9PEZI|nr:uncharacterized protein P152DRAFT_153937 [Eremomyces bilateralis CBS 781.70]KAF1809600.1 hypothetical protein P152DRAFT_153937 [Eremomyces bilateralis CBS 781.70]
MAPSLTFTLRLRSQYSIFQHISTTCIAPAYFDRSSSMCEVGFAQTEVTDRFGAQRYLRSRITLTIDPRLFHLAPSPIWHKAHYEQPWNACQYDFITDYAVLFLYSPPLGLLQDTGVSLTTALRKRGAPCLSSFGQGLDPEYMVAFHRSTNNTWIREQDVTYPLQHSLPWDDLPVALQRQNGGRSGQSAPSTASLMSPSIFRTSLISLFFDLL